MKTSIPQLAIRNSIAVILVATVTLLSAAAPHAQSVATKNSPDGATRALAAAVLRGV